MGITLKLYAKLNTFCIGTFLKIEDYEGDSHKGRVIWYPGKFSTSFTLFHVR